MPRETGPGPNPRVTDDEILAVLRGAETPVMTTSGVADELPIKQRSAYDRLKSLEGDEEIRSMDVGMQAKVWWVPCPDLPTSEDDDSIGWDRDDPVVCPPRHKSTRTYHRPDCRYAPDDGRDMTLIEAMREGYEPCEVCNDVR